ncbi:MAG: hypothetical protein KC492_25545, partial [Myxococcales bacterium]|nr:hypothetical protein [Myxococcales bacterium]
RYVRIHAISGAARVTRPALGVAAPGTPPGREVVLLLVRSLALAQHAHRMGYAPTAARAGRVAGRAGVE